MGELADQVAALEDENSGLKEALNAAKGDLDLCHTNYMKTSESLDASNDLVELLTNERNDLAAQLAALTAGQPKPPFVLKFDPANPHPAWSFDPAHKDKDVLTRFTDHVHGRCGGHPNTGSCFCRVRAFLPEFFDFFARGEFSLSATIDVLTKIDRYVSLIRTDNYKAKMKTSGQQVGCATGDEWRIGLTCYSDGLVRLLSHHQGHGDPIELMKGPRIDTGKHRLHFAVYPTKGKDGWWSVTIDGQVWGEDNVQTVPSTVPDSQMIVTRAVTLIDGANKWTDKVFEADLYEARFMADAS